MFCHTSGSLHRGVGLLLDEQAKPIGKSCNAGNLLGPPGGLWKPASNWTKNGSFDDRGIGWIKSLLTESSLLGSGHVSGDTG